MNKRLYLLAGSVLLLTTLSVGTVVYLQGDFKALTGQTSTPTTETVRIELSENGTEVSSDAVNVSEGTVTITKAGQYEITGQAPTVTVQVADSVSDDVTLRLNNASLASLDLQSSGTNIVELVKESTNSLTGGEAGISTTNITLTGEGSLAISEVNSYGILATDDLIIDSGNLSIDSAGSGLYAFHETKASQGNLTINGGNLTITSSQQEGAALFAGNELTINNGVVTVDTAYEAYVSKKIAINGGTANLATVANGLAARDSFAQEGQNSEASIEIKGGTNTITAGTSPLLANGNINLAGGVNTFMTSIPEQPIFNYTDTAEISGGTLIALGSADLNSSNQQILLANLIGNAGDTVTITDAAGNEVASYVSPVSFTNVTYSSENLTENDVYYLSTTSGNYGQATATKGSPTTP